MKKRLYVIIYIFLIFLSGCQIGQLPSSVAPNQLLPPAATASRQTAAPPAQLNIMTVNATAVLGDIGNKDWAAAKNKAHIIYNSMNELKPILHPAIPREAIDSLANAVSALDSAVNSNKRYDAVVQANMITRLIPDIADYYATAAPTDVMRLASLGRELAFEVRHQDWAAAKTNVRTAKGLWLRMKPALRPAHKQDTDRFQSNIDRLAAAIVKRDTVNASAEVKIFLENIAALEKDFTALNEK